MIARTNRAALSLIFVAAVGFAFTPLGCGRSSPPAVSVPEDTDLARQLRACAAKHEDHLGSARQAMSFDVHLTDDGDVDSVALRDATLRDEELETCMAYALRSLTADALPMRFSSSRPRGPMAPESRAFFGQAELPAEYALEACLAVEPCAIALGVAVGVAFIAVTIYVHVDDMPKVVRRRPPPPATLATSLPTATAVPTAIPVPTEAAPRRPKPNLSRRLDAAEGGDSMWKELCRAMTNDIDAQDCWSRLLQSEQNKRGWCQNRFGKN